MATRRSWIFVSCCSSPCESCRWLFWRSSTCDWMAAADCCALVAAAWAWSSRAVVSSSVWFVSSSVWFVAAIAVLVTLSTAAAQQPVDATPAVPGIVRNGKWGAAALFVAATSLGLLEHHRANVAFDGLRELCGASAQCSIGQDGRYSDPVAEVQYQKVVSGDRAARSWFVGGQVALAGTAVLFVIELLHPRATTNIPFSGFLVKPTRSGTRIGLQLPVRLQLR